MRSATVPGKAAGAVLFAAVIAASACSSPPSDPIQLDRNIMTVDNRTSSDWTNVEIWLNYYFRVTVKSIPAKSRFQAPLDSIVAGSAQRCDPQRVPGTAIRR